MNIQTLNKLNDEELYDALEAEWNKGTNTREEPKYLNTAQIVILPQLFQYRVAGACCVNQSKESKEHAESMARWLNNNPEKDLEPVKVFPVGERFILIDGHHRVEAYKDRTKGWKVVPVVIFRGTFNEAWRESLASNIKTKLPLTQEDKSEAAWRIVKIGKVSPLKAIEEMSEVKIATIKRMSQRRTQMINQGINPHDYTWARARRLGKDYEPDRESEVERWASKHALKIRSVIPKSHLSNATIMKRIIEILSPSLDKDLAEMYIADEQGEGYCE